MSRLFFGLMFAFSLSIFTMGCGSSGPAVQQESRTQAEIDAADADYDAEMEAEEEAEGEATAGE